jgi:putative transposase
MPWKRMLAYITGSVNEDLLRRIEYLLEENRALRNQIETRILLTDHERRTLAEKAIALGKVMADAVIISPATILKWCGTALGHRPSGGRTLREPASSASIRTCCGRPTSLPPRFGPAGD